MAWRTEEQYEEIANEVIDAWNGMHLAQYFAPESECVNFGLIAETKSGHMVPTGFTIKGDGQDHSYLTPIECLLRAAVSRLAKAIDLERCMPYWKTKEWNKPFYIENYPVTFKPVQLEYPDGLPGYVEQGGRK